MVKLSSRPLTDVEFRHLGKGLKVCPKIVSEYDQEIPQSQTADNPVATRNLNHMMLLNWQKILINFLEESN